MLKRLFHRHKYSFIRNIHGDEIIHSGWKRSIWKCSQCDKVKLSDELNRRSR
jgi:hypothetical protein